MSEPVLVMGSAVTTPAGQTVDDVMVALEAGKVLAQPAPFDTSEFRSSACTVAHEFDPSIQLSKSDVRRMPRAVQLTAATGLELGRSVDERVWRNERSAIVVGTGIGGLELYDSSYEQNRARHRGMSPLTVPMIMPSAAASELSIRLGVSGTVLTVSGACASSLQAVIHGCMLIRSGMADVVLAGGGEGLLSPTIYAAFSRTDAMARSVNSLRGPFDRNRDGFALGEGAGFVILANERGLRLLDAEPVGQIVGVGQSSDAFHIAAPDPEGAGAAQCMERALRDGQLRSDDVGHVVAHGTATVAGDAAEAAAIGRVFGVETPPVTAHKGSLGHLLGGSGVVSLIAALRSAQTGVVPPIAGLDEPDPDLSLDLVRGSVRTISSGGTAVVNALAFGGLNTCAIVR